MSYQSLPAYGTTLEYCIAPAPVVVYQATGNCPACRVGYLQSEMTCLGIFCCILFFPLGLVCLFLIQDQRCATCGYISS